MRLSRTLVAAVLAVAAASTATAQQRKLDRWHEDKKHGFKIQIPHKWIPIPTQPKERHEIGRYATGALYDPETNEARPTHLWMIRIDRARGLAPVPGTEAAKPERSGKDSGEGKAGEENIEEKLVARTFMQWLKESSFSRLEGVVVREQGPAEFGSFSGEEFVFTSKVAGEASRWKGYAGVVSLADQDLAFVYLILEAHFDKWLDLFKQSVRTFRTIERSTTPAPEEVAGLTERERDIRRHRADVSRTPGWRFAMSPRERYFIKYNMDDRRFLEEVKARIEAIRDLFEEHFPPEKPIEAVPVLRLVRNYEEYIAYGGGGGAYFSPYTGELVVPSYKEIDINNTYAALNHEAFHQYIYHRAGELSPHSWYNEGTGDYFGGWRFKYGRFTSGKMDVGGFNRVETIRLAIRSGSYVPLEKIVRYTQSQYYANGQLCYAEGWSLVYFLREGKGSPGWNPAWERILPTYFETIVKTKKPDPAVDKAFEGVDFRELEEAWKRFTLR